MLCAGGRCWSLSSPLALETTAGQKGFAGSADDNHERRKRRAGAGTNELDTALDKSQFDVWFGLVVVLVP